MTKPTKAVNPNHIFVGFSVFTIKGRTPLCLALSEWSASNYMEYTTR